MIDIKIKKLSDDVVLPQYAHDGDSGMDVRAYIEKELWISSGLSAIIPTGLIFADIPEGYEIQVRSRSGLAAKNQVFVLNSPGTIDSNYRGDLRIILMNNSKSAFLVTPGDRIAQIVLQKVPKMNLVLSDDVSETNRNSGGFGSTGVL
jgi:dUTP pyrophosphatase